MHNFMYTKELELPNEAPPNSDMRNSNAGKGMTPCRCFGAYCTCARCDPGNGGGGTSGFGEVTDRGGWTSHSRSGHPVMFAGNR
jgi:hypothetical protein